MCTFSRHSEQSGTQPAPQVSEARRQTVETSHQVWIRKPIDLSRRNNLLYFRPLKTGTLDLASASSEKLRDLPTGENVVPGSSALVPERFGFVSDDPVPRLKRSTPFPHYPDEWKTSRFAAMSTNSRRRYR